MLRDAAGMADVSVDFAVFGATPMAGLVAGLLAAEHGRRVCLVGEPWSPYRLVRRVDLAAVAATRPDTWALLVLLTAETTRLLNAIGKGLVERVDPLLVAETGPAIDAVSHLRHVVAAYGYAVERIGDRALTENGTVLRLRDVAMLAESTRPAIEAWLDRLGVRRMDPAAIRASLRRDGGARLTAADATFDAGRIVLADDAAVLRHAAPDADDPVLRARCTTAVLTEPARALKAPLINFLDRQTVLVQRHKGAGILALADGRPDHALPRIGASLAELGPLKRAAQASFGTLVTADGAPLVGNAKGSRAIVIAGFGDAGAFFAPALARQLAGAGSPAEQAWFAARGPARGRARLRAADYVHPDALAVPA